MSSLDATTRPRPRDAVGTRARMIAAAQVEFAERGYAQAGLRDIAERAGIASSLVIKYFGSKAGLFAAALQAGLGESGVTETDKAHFGALLVRSVADPGIPMTVPAMIVLAIGDAEARGVVEDVVRDHVIGPLGRWLGPPDAEGRAASLLMLSLGFAMFDRHLDLGLDPAARAASGALIAKAIQSIVSGDRSAAGL